MELTKTPKIGIYGCVHPALISVSPSALDFNIVSVGSNAQRNFTIFNVGHSPLVISSISDPFATYTTNFSNGVIPSGGSQDVTVTYTPTGNGSQNGNIIVNSNATNNNNIVSVTATGFLEILTKLDGVSNEMRTAVHAVLFPYTSAFTISTYILTPPNIASATNFFLGCNENTNQAIFFGIETSRLIFGKQHGGNQQKVITNLALLSNTLYKVDFVSEGAGASNLKIYVNNVLYATTISTNNTISSGSPSSRFYVGAYGNSGLRYAGNIAYLRTYNKALTSTERTEQFNSFLPLDIPELVNAWEFQDSQNSATRVDSESGQTLTLFNYTAGQQLVAQRNLSDLPI